jgi:hypothetical protein
LKGPLQHAFLWRTLHAYVIEIQLEKPS